MAQASWLTGAKARSNGTASERRDSENGGKMRQAALWFPNRRRHRQAAGTTNGKHKPLSIRLRQRQRRARKLIPNWRVESCITQAADGIQEAATEFGARQHT